ncbi:metal-dependent hydrolase [Pseudoneobacillus sp. C159]
MLYKTHIATSIAAGAAIATLTSFPFTVLFLGGVSFGSLLPDVDEPRSFIGQRAFGISKIINRRYGHRGITHSLFTWALFTILVLLFNNPFTIGLSLGYLFHIGGDYFSKSGVPLFKPISNKRFKFLFTYKTSSTSELIIFYAAIFAAIFLILNEPVRSTLTYSIADLLAKLLEFAFEFLEK